MSVQTKQSKTVRNHKEWSYTEKQLYSPVSALECLNNLAQIKGKGRLFKGFLGKKNREEMLPMFEINPMWCSILRNHCSQVHYDNMLFTIIFRADTSLYEILTDMKFNQTNVLWKYLGWWVYGGIPTLLVGSHFCHLFYLDPETWK